MSITIVRGTNKKPAASRALTELLAHRDLHPIQCSRPG